MRIDGPILISSLPLIAATPFLYRNLDLPPHAGSSCLPLEVFQLVLPTLPPSAARALSQTSKYQRSQTLQSLAANQPTAQQLLTTAIKETCCPPLEPDEDPDNLLVQFVQLHWRTPVQVEAIKDVAWLLKMGKEAWGVDAPNRLNLQVMKQ